MRIKVVDSIDIQAAPEVVWSTTVDVERWPGWTPTVTTVRRLDDGPFRLGSVARIKQPMQPEAQWVVTEYDEGHRFAWETRRRGLYMKGTHELRPAGTGTENVLSVEARGVVAVLFRPLLRLAMRRALADENRGLKAHCERISGEDAQRRHRTSP